MQSEANSYVRMVVRICMAETIEDDAKIVSIFDDGIAVRNGHHTEFYLLHPAGL